MCINTWMEMQRKRAGSIDPKLFKEVRLVERGFKLGWGEEEWSPPLLTQCFQGITEVFDVYHYEFVYCL